jgi:uncharacterized membrane protein YqgA involved in biofilm formation
MPAFLVGKGTVLNVVTVVLGSLLGLAAKQFIHPELERVVISGLGLVTICLGLKLFLSSKSVLIVAAAIALGGILGTLIGIHAGIVQFSEWAREQFGAGESSTFAEAVVAASVLFCVGPMTLMGCLQESLERKIDLIAIKSTLDLFAAMFLTLSMGPGVLVSAFVILVVQGGLTILGSRLEPFVRDERFVCEATAAGGPILLAIGLGLLGIVSLPTSNFVPALVLAPAFVGLGDRIAALRKPASP